MQYFQMKGEALTDDLWESKKYMEHQFGSSGLDNEGYNKEVGGISDYAFCTHIQSRPNVHGKPLKI